MKIVKRKENISAEAADLQTQSLGLMTERPSAVNVGIKGRAGSASNGDYTCTLEVAITDVLGVKGSSLSVRIECSENPALDTTISGVNTAASKSNQGVLMSEDLQVSIEEGIESYSLQLTLYEDGEEIQSETFTALIYTILDPDDSFA